MAGEHHLMVVNDNDSAVGDGYPEEIAGEVEQGWRREATGLQWTTQSLFQT